MRTPFRVLRGPTSPFPGAPPRSLVALNTVLGLAAACLAGACGGAARGSGGEGGTATGIASATAGSVGEDAGTDTVSTSMGSASAAEATGNSGGTHTAGSSTGGSSQGPKFDVAEIPDTPGGCDGGGGGGGEDFAYIWISNSPEGTVSKINTRTLLEEARYQTGPGPVDYSTPDPSRTSVNLNGDVAVVNRAGSVTKIVTRLGDCADTNGTPGIQTSSGANNVLAWGEEECVMWNTPIGERSRPAAWTAGTQVDGDCGAWEGAQVWVSSPSADGIDTTVTIFLLNGDDGSIDNQVSIPGGGDGYYGVYGAAVDQNDDFWGVGFTTGPLVHVRIADMSYETFPLAQTGAYGFTVDHAGRPWVGYYGGVQRFDPLTSAWTLATVPGGYTNLSRGMQEDGDGILWITAMSTGILGVDTDSAVWSDYVLSDQLPGLSQGAGISVDVDGKVWLVDTGASGAFVYDPVLDTATFVGGLNAPYTYSDMTGWGLKNVANPTG